MPCSTIGTSIGHDPRVAWLVACVDECCGRATVDMDGWCVLEEHVASLECTVTLGGRTQRRRGSQAGWCRRQGECDESAVCEFGNFLHSVFDKLRRTAVGRRPKAIAASFCKTLCWVPRYRNIYYISSRFPPSASPIRSMTR